MLAAPPARHKGALCNITECVILDDLGLGRVIFSDQLICTIQIKVCVIFTNVFGLVL
jgi:hypothetical protein